MTDWKEDEWGYQSGNNSSILQGPSSSGPRRLGGGQQMNEAKRQLLLFAGNTLLNEKRISTRTTVIVQGDDCEWFNWPLPGGNENERIRVRGVKLEPAALITGILAIGYGAVTDTLVVRLRSDRN